VFLAIQHFRWFLREYQFRVSRIATEITCYFDACESVSKPRAPRALETPRRSIALRRAFGLLAAAQARVQPEPPNTQPQPFPQEPATARARVAELRGQRAAASGAILLARRHAQSPNCRRALRVRGRIRGGGRQLGDFQRVNQRANGATAIYGFQF
jgi:hypothetical protein